MNARTNTADDLSPAERELSELLFAHYHSNPRPNGTSRLTNDIARNLRGDEACILRIAACLAKMVAPEHADKVGEVIGFYIKPARPSGSIQDLFDQLLNPQRPRITEDMLLNSPIKDPILGVINPLVLWAHAFQELQEYCADVTFDPEYAEVADDNYRPAIHGEGVNIVSVNGAIIAVLIRNNLMDEDYFDYLATDADEDGWVFSRGGIES